MNVEKSYYRDFFDCYDQTQRKFNDWHDPYGLQKHHHGHGHGHGNSHNNHNNSHDHKHEDKSHSNHH